jgi:hypothetical protein
VVPGIGPFITIRGDDRFRVCSLANWRALTWRAVAVNLSEPLDDCRTLGDFHKVPGIEARRRDVLASVYPWLDHAGAVGVNGDTIVNVADIITDFRPNKPLPGKLIATNTKVYRLIAQQGDGT